MTLFQASEIPTFNKFKASFYAVVFHCLRVCNNKKKFLLYVAKKLILVLLIWKVGNSEKRGKVSRKKNWYDVHIKYNLRNFYLK